MALQVTQVTPALASQYRDALYDFARNLDTGWRCNTAAVAAGNLLASHPSREAFIEFLQRDDATVLVVRDGTTIKGYAIVTANASQRGASYWRWLGILPLPLAQMRNVFQLLIDAIVAKYGSTWGRVTHQQLHNLIRDNIAGVAEDPDDPDVLVWVG